MSAPLYPRTTITVTVRCPSEYDAEGDDIPLAPHGECGHDITVSAEVERDGDTIAWGILEMPDRCPGGHTWDRSDRATIEQAADEAIGEAAWEEMEEAIPCPF